MSTNSCNNTPTIPISNAFDVIFVDEADAFPYTADETLRRAVKKAAKENAPIHSVTATPSKKLIFQK